MRILVPVPLAFWEPRLLITNETPDPEFQATLDSYLLVRSRTLGLRQGLRVRQSVLAARARRQAARRDGMERRRRGGGTRNVGALGPPPAGGGLRSRLAAGLHQHYFERATTPFAAGTDRLYCWVHLDPDNPPRTLMLQWHVQGGDWEHRAYWGENLISMGVDGTTSRAPMGDLPTAGGWVRLEVKVSAVRLSGAKLDGMAFTLFDGTRRSASPAAPPRTATASGSATCCPMARRSSATTAGNC